ncbi:endo-1,4-beta-xylanase [Thalassotalea sp. PLHSN55]|uniref:endo-1,4-beta-xylanase n=1 Tax=Thalassotalea sp. PLHSN55 TaxID=3435888 RepID=UPI003F824073
MNKKITTSALLSVSAMLLGCNNSALLSEPAAKSKVTTGAANISQTKDIVSLQQHFAEHFKIGTALSRAQILKEFPQELVAAKAHFSTFTPENSMKWERIHPEPEVYDFLASDALVAFAQENNQELVGHTLVWHSQTPDWVFENDAGEPLTREQLLARMEQHINKVAGRYKDKIFAWDVVNEAFNEDGTLRESKWLEIIGPDFLAQAFTMAQKAAPNAKLYYNDYNLFKPEKRAGVIKLVNDLKANGVRIDGIGMQGHYALDYPDLSQMEDSIIAFAQTGVEVMITELDISVLPFPEDSEQGADVGLNVELQAKYNPYVNGLPLAVEQQLADRYKQLFTILKQHSDKLSRVTFWGVSDRQTWRNDWPMTGRTDYPLLLDRELKVKSFVTEL